MVMFTELLRFKVADGRHEGSSFSDLCIALLEEDYPPVTHLLIRREGELLAVEWSAVSNIDLQRRRIELSDSATGRPAEDHRDVLLGRDLMDALVIDLLGRRTTRVCDLWLEEENGKLHLKGADAGFAALLRRVMGDLIGRPKSASLFDWKYVEFLRGDPSAVASGAGYRLRINRLPAGEIAQLADYVPYLHAAELIQLLPDEKAADVLAVMSIERQLQVIEELDEDEAVGLVGRMSPDLATDLLGRLEIDTMRRFLAKLSADRREKIIELLRYPEDSVGGVMVNDLIVLPSNLTVAEAQEKVQGHIRTAQFISRLFVVDDEPERKLRGSLLLRELLVTEPEQRLEDLMNPFLETLDPYDRATDAAYRVVSGQLEAMAVTNSDGRLIGAMTIAAAVSLLVPQSSGLKPLRVFS